MVAGFHGSSKIDSIPYKVKQRTLKTSATARGHRYFLNIAFRKKPQTEAILRGSIHPGIKCDGLFSDEGPIYTVSLIVNQKKKNRNRSDSADTPEDRHETHEKRPAEKRSAGLLDVRYNCLKYNQKNVRV